VYALFPIAVRKVVEVFDDSAANQNAGANGFVKSGAAAV